MKLIVGGSTGFVGAEVVRQAIMHPSVTSVVALGRREAPPPPTSEIAHVSAKLVSIVCENFENYPPAVSQALEGADACIWCIAVVPSKMNTVPWEDVCKVCRDYPVTAIKSLTTGPRRSDRPFRFIYVSGIASQRTRDEAEKSELLSANPSLMEYMLVRGDAEVQLLSFADHLNKTVEVCVVKPGMVQGPGREKAFPGIPNIKVEELAACMLDQVVNGIEKDTLTNEDMVRIGRKAPSKHWEEINETT